MGIHARSNNERLRTIWSSEMDQYFITLMLEQVNQGNGINGSLFSKSAWMDMMSAFNEKFKFLHDKDILKNRHKVLRNLYRAVKKLLNQRGFRWDDNLQMVTADNKVWDDYTKVHSDARSFRIRTIPYYRDLCIIFKEGETSGKSGPCEQNSQVGEHITVSDTGKSLEGLEPPDEHSSNSRENTNSAITPSISACEGVLLAVHDTSFDKDNVNSFAKSSDKARPLSIDTSLNIIRSRTIWQPSMDRYLIDLMVDHLPKGNRNDGTFPRQVWIEMATLFNAKFGFKYDIEIFKNRFKTMRRPYKLVKNLLDLDGFSWDETKQMVTAADGVWQDYIKTHTKARHYMGKPVPYYNELCIICRDMSNDRRDNLLKRNLFLEDDVLGVKSVSPLKSPETSNSSEDQVDDAQEYSIRVSGQKDKRDLKNPCVKRARSDDVGVDTVLQETENTDSLLTDKKKDDLDSSLFSVENVVKAIQALPEMDEDLILDACDFLGDEKKAKMFMALDFKLRKKWILRKLRPQQS